MSGMYSCYNYFKVELIQAVKFIEAFESSLDL